MVADTDRPGAAASGAVRAVPQPRISVVLNTLNEERNLPNALASVHPWADEIVVVDMESADRTVEIARSFGATVLSHPPTEIVDAARAFAVSQATGDWILILDADEVVPEPLSRRLREIAGDGTADVVVIPWINHLLGAPLGHTGWGPHQDRHPRFFRPAMMRVGEAIHGYLRPLPEARLLELPADEGVGVLHFNYVDTSHFLGKLDRYTTVEARQAYERGERYSGRTMVRRAAREVIARYWRRGGYRDGWRGLCLSLLMGAYRVATYAKLAEIEDAGSAEGIRARYQAEADRAIRAYRGAADPDATLNPH